jgi:hypothetical protein
MAFGGSLFGGIGSVLGSTPVGTIEGQVASAVTHTARTLLDRLTRKEISTEQFFRLANNLSDRELELLSELLRQRRIKAVEGGP